MATQTVIASGPPSQSGATLKLHNGSTDSLVASAAASETSDGSTVYTAAFTDVADGTYRLKFVNSNGAVRWVQWVTLTLTTGTFVAYEVPEAASVSAASIADAVCDELLSGHSTAGSLGKTLSNLAQNVSAGRITVVSRIEGDTITLHIDDDYKVRSGTELEIPVTDAGSVLFTRLDALNLDDLSFGASREGQSAGEITGTVASLTHANGVTTFTIEITGCGSGLRPGTGLYQIQSSETHSNEHDDHIEVSGPLVLERRVVAPRG